VAKSPAVFNYAKLKWINRQHLKKVAGSKKVALVRPFLEKKGLKMAPTEEPILAKVVEIYWEEVDTLAQLAERIAFFWEETLPQEPEAWTLLQKEENLKILAAWRAEIEKVGQVDQNSYRQMMGNLNQILGISGKALLLPIRAALTGRIKGPELEKIFLSLGKEKILNKIDYVLKARAKERSE
jgi:nondiscriminating glutamyl-tRNA synthetase